MSELIKSDIYISGHISSTKLNNGPYFQFHVRNYERVRTQHWGLTARRLPEDMHARLIGDCKLPNGTAAVCYDIIHI